MVKPEYKIKATWRAVIPIAICLVVYFLVVPTFCVVGLVASGDGAKMAPVLGGVLVAEILAAVFFLVPKCLMVHFMCLTVNAKTVSGSWGIISVRTMDEPMQHVTSINVYQGIAGRLFHYGTIGVCTTSGEIKFDNMPEPTEIKKVVMEYIEEYQITAKMVK